MRRGGRHEAPGVGEGARARSTVGGGGVCVTRSPHRRPRPPLPHSEERMLIVT